VGDRRVIDSLRSAAPRSEAPLLPVALSFTAGYVDTLGFIALFGFFSAHVTGNFVLLGAALVDPHHAVLAKLLALPVFMLGVAATHIHERILGRQGRPALARTLGAFAVFLLLFLVLGVAATPIDDADAPLAVMAALSAAFAMGVQNAVSRTMLSSAPPTIMTGNVTQLVLDGVDLLLGVAPDARPAVRARFDRLWRSLVAFAAGAAAGAVGYLWFGFPALLVPLATVVACAVRAPRA
jgi:uncharacterized membrane protein YoaK (UPF0700 family)